MVLLIFPYLVADATWLGWEALSLSSTNGRLGGRVVVNGRRVVVDDVMPGRKQQEVRTACPCESKPGGMR